MKKLCAILMATMLLLAGCQQGTKATDNTPKPATGSEVGFKGKYVVNVEYIKKNMGNKNFLAVDARGEKAATEGTLKGAIAVMWQQFSDVSNGKPGDALWGTVLPADQLGVALTMAGMSKDKDIVVFADTKAGWGEDGRILWMLAMAGYENVKILDGGMEAIKSAGLEIVKGGANYTPEEVVIDKLDYKTFIDTDQLAKRITENPKLKIIDTRSGEEYQGATKYGEAKGGHIPNAINIDFVQLFRDGHLKSNDEIVKLFEEKGITKDDEIVTYCTAGIRSGYMVEVLEMCGFTNVKNYDESYYRWAKVNDVEK